MCVTGMSEWHCTVRVATHAHVVLGFYVDLFRHSGKKS